MQGPATPETISIMPFLGMEWKLFSSGPVWFRGGASRRSGSFCSGGNIAAAAVLALVAVCSLGGCAPVYAKGAPLATPDLNKSAGSAIPPYHL